EMFPSKNIVQNAVNSADHTTLVAAVKAAGLVDTLQGTGPFTVFAPTNAAFDKLPAGTVETLLKPENKATLSKVLTYHVVAGRLSAPHLEQPHQSGNWAAANENKATLSKVLTYHVVAGRLTASDLDQLIKQGNGAAELTTVSGGKLWVMK